MCASSEENASTPFTTVENCWLTLKKHTILPQACIHIQLTIKTFKDVY